MNLPAAKLDAILTRHAALVFRLGENPPTAETIELSRELSQLQPIVAAIEELRATEAQLAGTEAMLAEPAIDPEMRELALAERAELMARLDDLRQSVRLMLLPKDEADEKGAILEVRAGTGGDEAALFAGDLFRMYARYAASKGWSFEVLSQAEGSVGGVKEAIAEVRGRGAYARLRFESGVHRVQRVPETEASGRIHTSAATVAVLPEAEDLDMALDETELRIDTMRASGAGGQHVNKTESAIRITHIPSGHRGLRPGRTLAASQPGEGARDPCARGFTTSSARAATTNAPRAGAARSAPATARNASGPIISRKGA